jgi:lipid-A-disaccharide synthase
MTRAELCAQFGFDPGDPLVALLPGSRPSELAHNFPTILDACRELIRLQGGNGNLMVGVAPGLSESELARYARPDLWIYLAVGRTYDALAAADVAIVASGTATVEAALLGVPMVVVYRVSATTAFIARRLVRTPHFAMVNLIAGRRVVQELIQEDFTAEAVAREASRLLTDNAAREQMKRDLAEVRAKLGPGGAIDRAAEIIAGML